ncbi:DNA recombination protein RmuC [Govanella unica]|uniref:DNA recombination protein RmuC homolog n=1 Tax=Govanella unica TaxID=2975056 RepID=A0A9X3TWN8_9PROT|nr:DNA recombination protein RmuC [Govania unica]MDA5192954.1 DNA recombination protein RmuC [Govania unica]
MDVTLGVMLGGFAVILLFGIFLWLRADRSRLEDRLRLEQVTHMAQSLDVTNRELMGRLAQLAESQNQSSAALTKTLETRLDSVTLRMGESLEKSATTTAKTIGELQTRLTVIDEAQKRIAELSGQVVGLQDILANKQARGAFGEIQLNAIVQNALPPSAYAFQVVLSNGKRADCIIHLPNPPGSIVVDAKFPLESYHLLRAATDPASRTVAERQFTTDILKHVAAISDRYILEGETAESALMFLPSEAIYAELHANFPAVLEKSYAARVWIVSPTTLMATLNTVRAVLKDARMREQAHVIQREVRTLLTDVGRLAKRVENLTTHFGQAQKDITEITTSANKITARGERIEELQLEEPEVTAVVAPARAALELS